MSDRDGDWKLEVDLVGERLFRQMAMLVKEERTLRSLG